MPLQRCEGTGWRYGKSGKCYKGLNALTMAKRQARAIKASQARQGKPVHNRSRNPLKFDPTLTSNISRQFYLDIAKRITSLQKEFYKQITTERLTVNRSWQELIQDFARRITTAIVGNLGMFSDAYWVRHLLKGYMSGAERGYDRVRHSPVRVKSEVRAVLIGEKTQFLGDMLVSTPTVNLLNAKLQNELTGLADNTSQRIGSRILQGLLHHESQHRIAKAVSQEFQVTKKKAEMIVRTEIARINNEGQLDSMERLGVRNVGIVVEYRTSRLGMTGKGNPSPCHICAPLDGLVLEINEARGLLPRHPNCLCTWIPANVSESTKGQRRSKTDINEAIRKSLQAEMPKHSMGYVSRWPGAAARISEQRPKPIVSNEFDTTQPGRWITLRDGRKVYIPEVRSVVSETDHHHAEMLLTQGVEPSFKRERAVTEYGPGAGLDRQGLYVADEKAFSKGSYGGVRLHLDLERGQMATPEELTQLGYDEADVEFGLGNEQGAVTKGYIPREAFKRVEVYDGGQWVPLSPEQYLQSRGLSNVPKLPTMREFEDQVRKHADEWALDDRNIDKLLTDYNRADVKGKIELAESANLLTNTNEWDQTFHNPDIIRRHLKKHPSKTKLSVQNPDTGKTEYGHWVTIKGNPVFIRDDPKEKKPEYEDADDEFWDERDFEPRTTKDRLEFYWPEYDEDDIKDLSGAVDGAEIDIMSVDGDHIEVEVSHEDYWAERHIYRDYIENRSLTVFRRKEGLGSEIFESQVKAGIKHGLDRIETEAVGNIRTASRKISPLNGYYTWARFGYDARIPKDLRNEAIRAFGPNTIQISDLMRTREGREWWLIHGTGFQGIFDLREGSLSRKTFKGYLREKHGDPFVSTRRGKGWQISPRELQRKLPIENKQIEYASTQVNITDPDCIAILKTMQQDLDPAHIVELETEPHVTVLYGLLSNDPRAARAILSGTGPIVFEFGELGVFEAKPGGFPENDVLYVSIKSIHLKRLHQLLKTLPHNESHPKYTPHVTLAYLKPGTAHYYTEILNLLYGKALKSNEIIFSGKDRTKETITTNRLIVHSDCGAGSEGDPGFQPENDCAADDGGPIESSRDPRYKPPTPEEGRRIMLDNLLDRDDINPDAEQVLTKHELGADYEVHMSHGDLRRLRDELKMDPVEMAQLSGAQPGATVMASIRTGYGPAPYALVELNEMEYGAERHIYRDFIRNHAIEVHERGQGLGTKIFGTQVDAAIKRGMSHIETTAVGTRGYINLQNGYYTWARLGYDADLKKSPVAKDTGWFGPKTIYEQARKEGFAGTAKLSDLMSTKEGRAWWYENGGPFQGTFELSEGSTSRRVFDTYRKEKGIKTNVSDCGAGSVGDPGFQLDNDCAAGDGGLGAANEIISKLSDDQYLLSPEEIGGPYEVQGRPSDFRQMKDLDLTPLEVAKLSGAQPGDLVAMESFRGETPKKGIISTEITTPEYRLIRRIHIDHIENYEARVHKTGQGIGARIFGTQVDAAIAKGFKSIKTHAVGGPDTGYNGYYTWARFGFDASLDRIGPTFSGDMPSFRYKNLGQEVREKAFPDAHTISDLMTTPERREWWRKHGKSFDGTFDLSEGSLSRRVYDAYRNSKKGVKNVSDCGAGSEGDPGFQPDNDCAADKGFIRIETEDDLPEGNDGITYQAVTARDRHMLERHHRHLSLPQIGRLSGALPDSEVSIAEVDEASIAVQIDHPDYHAYRRIYNDWIENIELDVHSTGQGIGTRILGTQVDEAVKLGFDRIEAQAVGYYDALKNGGPNGYYTWARLGYDGYLNEMYPTGGATAAEPTFREQVQKIFPGAQRISDLMKSPEGREWWLKNGKMFNGTFDLNEGSYSRKVFDEYRSTVRPRDARHVTQREALKDKAARIESLVGRQFIAADRVPEWAPITPRRQRKLDLTGNMSECGAGNEGDPGFQQANDCAKGGGVVMDDQVIKVKVNKELVKEIDLKFNLSPGDVAKVSGALPGARTDIEQIYDGRTITVKVDHPDYTVETFVNKEYIELKGMHVHNPGQGIGTKVLQQQVRKAAALGFQRIETRALRGLAIDGIGGSNGYYTFARLGFDARIPGSVLQKAQQRFPGAERISDLMKTQEGRQWWRTNGKTFNGTFDLTTDSLSRRLLDAYGREKETTRNRATAGLDAGGRRNPGSYLGFNWRRGTVQNGGVETRFDTTKPGRWVTLPDKRRVYIETDPRSVEAAESMDSPAWTAREESAYIDLADGSHMKIDGTETQVTIPDSISSRMKDAVFTHNHPEYDDDNGWRHPSPGGSPLTMADVRLAANLDLKEIRTFGQDYQGRRWITSMKRPERGWEINKVEGMLDDFKYQRFRLIDEFQPRLRKKDPSAAQDLWDEMDLLWKDIATRYGYEYTRKQVR